MVDEVWSIMQHPEGAAFMVSMAKRARKHRLGLQFITQDVQDLLSEDSSRAITGHSAAGRCLQNAAFKLLLQQDAAAVSTVGEAFDLPEVLQRWLLVLSREGDGLLLARGQPLSRAHRGHSRGDGGHRVAAGPQALNPINTDMERTTLRHQREKDAVRRRAPKAPSRSYWR